MADASLVCRVCGVVAKTPAGIERHERSRHPPLSPAFRQIRLIGLLLGADDGFEASEPHVAMVIDTWRRLVDTLRPPERRVLGALAVAEDSVDTIAALSMLVGMSERKTQHYLDLALAKLRHPSRLGVFLAIRRDPPDGDDDGPLSIREPSGVEVRTVLEQIRGLTPGVMAHLRGRNEDLDAVPPDVFEHLIAELLTSMGFLDVSLVGRNRETAADLFAAHKVESLGTRVRFFVEAKRRRDRIGIEVVHQVLGAMLVERPRHGWHAAMIVSAGGFKDFRNFSRNELKRLGVELKDRDDLLRWLEGYRPNKAGLWLPNPGHSVPQD